MQKYIDAIQNNLTELYLNLDKQLSLEHIGFDIDYKESHYSFWPPTTPKEHKQQARYKKAFIRRLLKDTLKKAVDTAIDEDYDPQNRWNFWDSVLSFDDQYLSCWEQINIGERPIAYDVVEPNSVDGVRAKSLDIESQYLFMQRKDLTPEMLQEFFKNKFKNSFDSEPQHANMTLEDSTKIEV